MADVKAGAENLHDHLQEKMTDFDQAVHDVLQKGKSVVDNFTEGAKTV